MRGGAVGSRGLLLGGAIVPLLPLPQLVGRAGIIMLAMMSDFVIACDVLRSVLLR